jgi:hypothetical protein
VKFYISLSLSLSLSPPVVKIHTPITEEAINKMASE